MNKLFLLVIIGALVTIATATATEYQEEYVNSCDPASTTQDWASVSTNDFVVTSYTPTSNHNLSKIDVVLHSATGSSTGTLTAYIYSSVGDATNTLLATSNNTVDKATIGATAQNVTFYFTGYAVTSGTKYGLVLGSSNVDATHFLYMDICATAGEAARKGAAAVGLSTASNNFQWNMNISSELGGGGGGGGAPTGTVTLVFPKKNSVIQRDTPTTGDVYVNGTYAGNVTYVQYRVDGGAWTLLDAETSGGRFNGTIQDVAVGEHKIEVRGHNDGTPDTVNNVNVGDIYVITGQSNAVGKGTNFQRYNTSLPYNATVYMLNNTWKILDDPSHSEAGAAGSPWPLVANKIIQNQSIPVGFIAAAVSGSNVTSWRSTHPNYQKMLAGVEIATGNTMRVKAVLFDQGHTDAYTDADGCKGDYECYRGNLSSFINQTVADLDTDAVYLSTITDVTNIGFTATRTSVNNVRKAKIDEWNNNPNARQGALMYSTDLSGGGSHYETNKEIGYFATQLYQTLARDYYLTTLDLDSPVIDTLIYGGAQNKTLNLTFTEATGLTVNNKLTGGFYITNGTVNLDHSNIDNISIDANTVTLTLDTAIDNSFLVSLGAFNDCITKACVNDTSSFANPAVPFINESIIHISEVYVPPVIIDNPVFLGPNVSLSNPYLTINNELGVNITHINITNTGINYNNITIQTTSDTNTVMNATDLYRNRFELISNSGAFIYWGITTELVYSLYRYKNAIVHDGTTGTFTLTYLASGDEFEVLISNSTLNITATDGYTSEAIEDFTVTISTEAPFTYSYEETASGPWITIPSVTGYFYNITIEADGYFTNTTQFFVDSALESFSFTMLNTSAATFNFFDEETLLPLNNVGYRLTSTEGYAREVNLTATMFELNTLPDGDYTLEYWRDDYTQRKYYFTVPLTDFAENNVSLYLLKNTSSNTFYVRVTDLNNQVLDDTIVTVLRRYVIANQTQYIPVLMVAPTRIQDGIAAFDAVAETVAYLFRVTDQDTKTVLFQGAGISTTGLETVYLFDTTIILRVNRYTSPFAFSGKIEGLQTNLTNTTDTFYLSWEDTQNKAGNICLAVYTNGTGTPVRQCSSANSGIISYKIPLLANNTFYEARSIVYDISTNTPFVEEYRYIDNRNLEAANLFGNIGLFMLFAGFVVYWTMFATRPVVAMFFSVGHLIMFSPTFLGMVFLPPAAMGGLIVLAIVTAFMLERR